MFTDVNTLFIGLYHLIYKKYAKFSFILHSAFFDFLDTIHSNLPFSYSPSYSAFYSAHFILTYYTFISNSHFALFGGRFRWDWLDSNSDARLYPISTPVARLSLLSKVFLNKLTLNLLKLHTHIVFRTPPTNQSPEFTNTPFSSHIWYKPTWTATSLCLVFVFMLILN
jgi:hypothetical protein